jgi:hypothetical protein
MIALGLNNKNTFQSPSIRITQTSLVCTYLALGRKKNCQINLLDNDYLKSVYLKKCLLDCNLNKILKNIASQLIPILNTTYEFDHQGLYMIKIENNRIQQYLRKFMFLYSYYHLKRYPNDLSRLSFKKINMLAVRNLFLIQSL